MIELLIWFIASFLLYVVGFPLVALVVFGLLFLFTVAAKSALKEFAKRFF